MKNNCGRIQALRAQNAPKCHPASRRVASPTTVEVPTMSDEELLEEIRRIRAATAICRHRAEQLIRYLAA
jgi:hypothetical protein